MQFAVSCSALLYMIYMTSWFFWSPNQAQTVIYRGCAYRAVVGLERALWFCMADKLCAMFFCQRNNVFSVDDCGCVPPHHLHQSKHSDHKLEHLHIKVTMTTPDTTTTTPTALPTLGSSVKSSTVQDAAAHCEPEIRIDGLAASSPAGVLKDLYVEPRGVIDLGNGSAFYDGYSYLAVPVYNNARFDSGISVRFVLEEGTSPLRQVLMTNCKHGQGASVEIVLDVELGVILFHVMYRFREAVNKVESVVEVAVPYTAFMPKRVAMVFDGRTLKGRVNNSERSANVRGNGDYVLAQRGKPLMFGNTLCDVDDVYSFRGQIKEICIYRCVKKMTDLLS